MKLELGVEMIYASQFEAAGAGAGGNKFTGAWSDHPLPPLMSGLVSAALQGCSCPDLGVLQQHTAALQRPLPGNSPDTGQPAPKCCERNPIF